MHLGGSVLEQIRTAAFFPSWRAELPIHTGIGAVDHRLAQQFRAQQIAHEGLVLVLRITAHVIFGQGFTILHHIEGILKIGGQSTGDESIAVHCTNLRPIVAARRAGEPPT